MLEGEFEGEPIYLVTDERSVQSNALVEKLPAAMGEDPSDWVVRVFETGQPIPNAFVTGGKYIYVFHGLLEQATSEDEVAFVLAHELGHSLLKQSLRQQNDESTLLISLAQLGAMLSKKHSGNIQNVARFLEASYSRLDEEEADALAVAITRRAGFDPLRGVDFFSRMKRQQDKYWNDTRSVLLQEYETVNKALAECSQWREYFYASLERQTQENADRANAVCDDANNKNDVYQQKARQFNQAAALKQQESFFNSHPHDQSRIAAIAALVDYLEGRRDLESLAKFEHSAKVMAALNRINSVLLLKPEIVVADVEQAALDSE